MSINAFTCDKERLLTQLLLNARNLPPPPILYSSKAVCSMFMMPPGGMVQIFIWDLLVLSALDNSVNYW